MDKVKFDASERFAYERKASLHLEPNDSFEHGASFVWNDAKNHLYISVSEEQAVDSYNQMFECTLTADIEQAKQLRDWLIKILPP